MDRDEDLLRKHLQGAHLERIEKREYDWLFQFNTGCSISVESLWRLVSDDAIVVTSEDHAQKFGLPAPLDAGLVAAEKLGQESVARIQISAATSDLSLDFGRGRVLQFINTSSGYESWNFVSVEMQVIGRNGDRIIFSRNS